MQTFMAIWTAISFIKDHWGQIMSVCFGISELLGLVGKGGFIPMAYQAIIKKGAAEELSKDEAAKLEQTAQLKNK